MHWPLNQLTRTGRATLALAAGLMAFTAGAWEKVDYSATTNQTASSLAPIHPRDIEKEISIFGHSDSRGPSSGVALPPSYSPPQNALQIDSKTRARILQEWDRKKNWLISGSNKLSEAGKEKEEDPFEEVVNSRRTALEKRFLNSDSDGKQDRQKETRRQKDQDNADDPSATPDQLSDDKMLSSTSSRKGSGKGGADKDASQAYFSDPFERANVSKKSAGGFGSGRQDDKDKDQDADKDTSDTQAAIAARSAARIGQIFSLPNAFTGPSGPSAFSSVTEPFGQRNTHQDDLRNILGRDPNAISSVAGVLGSFASSRPAALAPARVSTFSQQPFFTPAPQPKRPDLIMQAQPGVLPRPVRDF